MVDEPSLARRIYGTRPPTALPVQYSFARIAEVVDGISQIQEKFTDLTRADESPAYRVLIQARDVGRRVVGLPPLYATYHQLFSENIAKMDQLCSVADTIFSGVQIEHEFLKETVDLSFEKLERQFHARTTLEKELPDVISQHKILLEFMNGMKPGDVRDGKNYFELRRKKLEYERAIDIQGKGAYALALDQEVGQIQISQFYEHMERLFRMAFITSMRVKEGSKDINEALRNTHRAYLQFDNLYRATLACKQGLASLAQFHQTLNRHFENGMQEITGILHEDPNLRMFSETNPQFGSLIAQIDQIEERRTFEQERIVRTATR